MQPRVLVIQPLRVPKWLCIPFSPPAFQNHAVLCTEVGIVTLSSAQLFFVIQAPKLGLDSANTLWKQLERLLSPPFLRA